MKVVRVMLVIALVGCGAAAADSLEGQGTAAGNAVLWFSGTSATGTFDGTFALSGQLILADGILPFSTSGWARGAGSGDTATMDIEAWATFAARGMTEAGEEIIVQGGLTLSGLTAGASGSSGSGTGDFVATIFIGGQQYTAQGSADGSATGDFVIPADPLSMELAGEGVFALTGELALDAPSSVETAGFDNPDSLLAASMIERLPWDPDTLPEEFYAQLLEILTTIVDISPPSEETL